jgi:hypothetical protein
MPESPIRCQEVSYPVIRKTRGRGRGRVEMLNKITGKTI